jgi:hypothetical protein
MDLLQNRRRSFISGIVIFIFFTQYIQALFTSMRGMACTMAALRLNRELRSTKEVNMKKSISAFIAAVLVTGLLAGVMILVGQNALGTSTANAEAAAAAVSDISSPLKFRQSPDQTGDWWNEKGCNIHEQW